MSEFSNKIISTS